MGTSKSNVVVVVVTFLLALLLTSSLVQGQTSTTGQTKLKGTVKDPSGAAMPAVDIAIIRDLKVLKGTKTDELGAFSLDLIPGQYQLGVIAPDFKPYAQTVRVVPNMPSLAITLSLEGLTTTVDVVGNNNEIIIDAAQSLDANVLTGAAIQDLPEDEEDLLAYLQSLAGGEGNAQIIIDGFEGGRLPRRDQIAQIVIEPNSFNATGTGPRITIVTRQPGPQGPWQGNASYTYRDSRLNARNPHSDNKPPSRRSVVSTGYRGPLIKGRLGMDINLSKEQYENGTNSIRAITPGGPIDKTFFSPSTYDSINFSNQLYFSQTHTMNWNFNYNRSKDRNQGIGNFTLEERASDNKNNGWNLNFSDNKTISPKMTNTFQFRIQRNSSSSIPRTDAIAINVLDAFNGGGAQNHSESRNQSWGFTDRIGWTPNPKLNFQFALNVNHQSSYNLSENNYLGTFTFSGLADFCYAENFPGSNCQQYKAIVDQAAIDGVPPTYQNSFGKPITITGIPVTFTQTTGNPLAEVDQTDANISMQLTYRISPTMSYGAGVQYAIQTHLKDYNNFSPTTSFQVQLKKRHTIMLGARLTYPNTGFSMFQYEQLLRGDGTTKQFNTVISNPSYPDPFVGGAGGTTTGVGGTSLQLRDPNFIAPYTLNAQIQFIELFPKNWRLQTAFNINRSVHQLRNRNINAPYPGIPLDSSLTTDEINILRPFYPFVGRINRYESVGNSLSKNLNIGLQLPSKKVLKVQISGNVQGTVTWAADDGAWQNPYDVRSDWARNDQRLRFQGTFQVRPPKVGNFNLNFNVNSGRAYTITTGRDDNFDQSTNDRPAGIPRNSLRGPGQYTLNLNWNSLPINVRPKKQQPVAAAPTGEAGAPPAAVGLSAQDQLIQSALNAGLSLANIQQLLLSNPGLIANAPTGAPAAPVAPPSLTRPRLNFRVSVQNLLNNTRVNGYSGVITSPLFGRPTGYGPGRTIQLGVQSSF
jgi:hypothetical protein